MKRSIILCPARRRAHLRVFDVKCLVTAVCLLPLLASAAHAQSQPAASQPASSAPSTRPDDVTVPDVQAKIAQLETAGDLDDALKKQLISAYRLALARLQNADRTAARIDDYKDQLKRVPAELARLQAAASQPVAESDPLPSTDIPVAQLELQLAKVERDRDEAQSAQVRLEGEPKLRANRKVEIIKHIAQLRQQVEDVPKEAATIVPAGDAADLATARRMLERAMRRALYREIRAEEAEMQYYDAATELLGAQRDEAVRRAAQLEKHVKAWREFVADRRRVEAQMAAAAAARAAANAHPAVKADAEKNAVLAALRAGPDGLSAKLEAAQAELDAAKDQNKKLKLDQEKLRERLDAAGLTQTVGLLLRKKREAIPSVSIYERRVRKRQQEMSDTLMAQLDRQQDRDELADIEPRLRAIIFRLPPGTDEFTRVEIESVERELLTKQKELLQAAITDLDRYFTTLTALNAEEQSLITRATAYAQFIDEQIFWVRSAREMRPGDLASAWAGLRWLLNPSSWIDAGRRLTSLMHPVSSTSAGLAAFLILAALRGRMKAKLRALGEHCSQSSAMRFALTLEALFLTLLMAADLPGLLWFLGWRLGQVPEAPDFVWAVSAGLKSTGAIYFIFRFFRLVCSSRGLAVAHFNWPANSVRLLRRHLVWLMLLGSPAVFVVAAMQFQNVDAWMDSLGRLAAIFGLFLLSLFSHFALRPSGGIMRDAAAHNPRGWVVRLRYVWYLLGVGTPLALAGLAVAGYVYTAMELTWRIHVSAWFTIGLITFHALLHRWIVVSHRWLAVRQARQKRAQILATEAVNAESSSTASVDKDPEEVDLWSISAQTRHLLRTIVLCALVVGLWAIWEDVLPALALLNRIELWHGTAMAKSAEGAAGAMIERIVPVTLGDVALALLTLLLTVVASKNLPGVLEISVLQRLPLSPGSRYAITSVSRYAITTLGLIIACGEIGIGWSKVQWLAAALTFGLGFGLQEIFANFISGLIILFERPVRLGDVVTVGGVTGKVSRIRIRATTIVDGDRRELIVPNKEFITGQLMNWTLSDTVQRVGISVGVAYGTDVELVRRLLLKASQNVSDVLVDPAPSAFFQQFGANTLDFQLSAFVASPDAIGPTRHALLAEIDKLFREAGIEISFPQHDLHLRSISGPIPIQVRGEGLLARALRGADAANAKE